MSTDQEMLKRLNAHQVFLTARTMQVEVPRQFVTRYPEQPKPCPDDETVIQERPVLVRITQSRWLRLWNAAIFDMDGGQVFYSGPHLTRGGAEKRCNRWLDETPAERAAREAAENRAALYCDGRLSV